MISWSKMAALAPASPYFSQKKKAEQTKRRDHLSHNIKGSNAIKLKKTNVLGHYSFYHDLPLWPPKSKLVPFFLFIGCTCPQKKVHSNLILGLSCAQNQDFGWYVISLCESRCDVTRSQNRNKKAVLIWPLSHYIYSVGVRIGNL